MTAIEHAERLMRMAKESNRETHRATDVIGCYSDACMELKTAYTEAMGKVGERDRLLDEARQSLMDLIREIQDECGAACKVELDLVARIDTLRKEGANE